MSTITIDNALAAMQQERVTVRKFNAQGQSQGSISRPEKYDLNGQAIGTNKRITNKYPGRCTECGVWVPAETGTRYKDNENSHWLVAHYAGECPPKEDRIVAPEPDPEVTDGFYIVDTAVYKVKTSKAGNQYAELLVIPPDGKGKGHFNYQVGAITIVRKQGKRLTIEDAKALGAEFHYCVICGIELTDPTSVERGIGPVCIKRLSI